MRDKIAGTAACAESASYQTRVVLVQDSAVLVERVKVLHVVARLDRRIVNTVLQVLEGLEGAGRVLTQNIQNDFALMYGMAGEKGGRDSGEAKRSQHVHGGHGLANKLTSPLFS